MIWVLGFVFILGISLLAGTGCQNKSAQEEMASKIMEKAIKEGTGKDARVDIQGGNIRIQTPEGSGEIRTTKAWSDDIPAEVPRFNLGNVNGVTAGEKDGKKSWTIAVDEVKPGAYTAYLEALKGKGWKINMTMSMGNGGSITASKGNLDCVAMFYQDQTSGVISVVQK
jgi:hypothetical protein